MGCVTCNCNAGMTNTGAGCSKIMRDAYSLVFVNLLANDGSVNGISLASTLNQAYFDALINNTDPSKRWFPLATQDGLKDVESVRPAPLMQSATDGTEQFIRYGVKPFKGHIRGLYATPVYVGKLEAIRCVGNMGVYKIDRGGNLIGMLSGDGLTLLPIPIDSSSFSATFIEATPDKNNAEIEIMFNFSVAGQDKDLAMIACSEVSPVNLLTLQGLVDVCAVVSGISVTGFTLKLTTAYGTPLNPTLDPGRVVADFISSVTSTTGKIRRTNNTPADVSITSVTESSTVPGTYTVVIPTATTGDTLALKLTKAGRDYSCANTTVITIP